ncbi:T9SS type A sorting domain-containing protein [Nafulsella turpanensis]|uniref:T9SS type A sorting domain-containing protein n=1 Tax=Nafulsella turpanensis TaxID=1265690 RepID=UPI001268064C|nr:T9SS type A sorting domain-containing protein [Nafulsella turpanensis]
MAVPLASTGQSITVDGNPGDWASIYDPGSTVTVKSLKRDANNTGDDQFTMGSQDRDPLQEWTWNIGNTNDKGDISNAGAALIGCNLYFFGDRTAINGDAQIGFWFFKDEVAPIGTPPSGFSGEHQIGDLLILTHFTNGGGEPLISIYEWVGSGGSHGELNEITGKTSSEDAMVNNQLYPVPSVTFEGQTWSYAPKSGGPGYVTGSFFEGSVNLCDLFGSVPCFSSFLLETRNAPSLNSLQASLQDLAWGNFDVTPSVTVDDQVVCEGGTAEFTATPHGGVGTLEYSWKIGDGAYSTYSTSNTLSIPNATEGTAVYVKVRGSNGCESDPDEGELTVNPLPALQNATADFCADEQSNTTLADFNDEIGALSTDDVVWYSDAARTTMVTSTGDLAAGPHTFYATVSRSYADTDSESCHSEAELAIEILEAPALQNATADFCEGEMVGVALSSYNDEIGALSTDNVVWYSDAARATVIEDMQDLAVGSHTFYATVSREYPEESCDSEASLTVNVEACSKIKLRKLTDGVVDPTMQWSFTISGGDLPQPITETVANDADGMLFESLVLSKDQTYTICETNVGAAFTVSIKYRDANGVLQDVSWYDPQVINGGGDFNQGEAIGNYCFEIGAGTSIPLPLNTYGSDELDLIFLEFEINNIPPPGGNARTPGYWKNWSSCSGGNQYDKVMEARENGGEKADFWLLDDHLPHTLWTSGTSSFTLTTCNLAVLILDERQNDGRKYAKMASDAAYKLAKHLMTYQLNKNSDTYECASAALAAEQAEALLAQYGFDGTKSSYISNKGKGGGDPNYAIALDLAKILDAYNNNLLCGSQTSSAAARISDGEFKAPSDLDNSLSLIAFPNPAREVTTIRFSSPTATQAVLQVYSMDGRQHSILFNGEMEAGKVYEEQLQLNKDSGSMLFYILQTEFGSQTGKIVTIRE